MAGKSPPAEETRVALGDATPKEKAGDRDPTMGGEGAQGESELGKAAGSTDKDREVPDSVRKVDSEKQVAGTPFKERAITVVTPDGEYLLVDNRSSPDDPAENQIRTSVGNTAHRFNRAQANARGLEIDFPASEDETRSIDKRIAMGEEVSAVERGRAKFPRSGNTVVIRYPNGEQMFAELPEDGQRLFAPGNREFVLDAKKALELGLDKWVAFKPLEPGEVPNSNRIPDIPDIGPKALRPLMRVAGPIATVAVAKHSELAMESFVRRAELWTPAIPGQESPNVRR